MASARDGGSGGMDIWTADRLEIDEPFGEAQNLGEPVNAVFADYCPTPRNGNYLMFVLERPACYQPFEMFGVLVFPGKLYDSWVFNLIETSIRSPNILSASSDSIRARCSASLALMRVIISWKRAASFSAAQRGS